MQCEYESELKNFGSSAKSVYGRTALESFSRAVKLAMDLDREQDNPDLRYFKDARPDNSPISDLLQRSQNLLLCDCPDYKELVPLFKSNPDCWDKFLGAPSISGLYVVRNGRIEFSIELASNKLDGSFYRMNVIPTLPEIKRDFQLFEPNNEAYSRYIKIDPSNRISTVRLFTDGKAKGCVYTGYSEPPIWRSLTYGEILRLQSVFGYTTQKLRLRATQMGVQLPDEAVAVH